MNEIAPLDPLQLPLHGIRLIEASAGTGKTWTLAALYLRLVLGHGGQPAQLPAQILVVTFTRAATAELRERIRERLANAAAAFRGQQQADDFLQRLIDAYPDAMERAAAARQLELAAQWMDEAAIYTIHGWSQRMLAQHAFEGSEAADDFSCLFEYGLHFDRVPRAEVLRRALQKIHTGADLHAARDDKHRVRATAGHGREIIDSVHRR